MAPADNLRVGTKSFVVTTDCGTTCGVSKPADDVTRMAVNQCAGLPDQLPTSGCENKVRVFWRWCWVVFASVIGGAGAARWKRKWPVGDGMELRQRRTAPGRCISDRRRCGTGTPRMIQDLLKQHGARSA